MWSPTEIDGRLRGGVALTIQGERRDAGCGLRMADGASAGKVSRRREKSLVSHRSQITWESRTEMRMPPNRHVLAICMATAVDCGVTSKSIGLFAVSSLSHCSPRGGKAGVVWKDDGTEGAPCH